MIERTPPQAAPASQEGAEMATPPMIAFFEKGLSDFDKKMLGVPQGASQEAAAEGDEPLAWFVRSDEGIRTRGEPWVQVKPGDPLWNNKWPRYALFAPQAVAGPAPAVAAGDDTSAPGVYRAAYLCFAWGETDKPSAQIVFNRAGVRQFIIDEWLGSEDSVNGSYEPALPEIMTEFDDHDWEDEPELQWEFEIGGVSIKQVCSKAIDRAAIRPSGEGV